MKVTKEYLKQLIIEEIKKEKFIVSIDQQRDEFLGRMYPDIYSNYPNPDEDPNHRVTEFDNLKDAISSAKKIIRHLNNREDGEPYSYEANIFRVGPKGGKKHIKVIF